MDTGAANRPTAGSTSDQTHIDVMRHCLQLTYNCDIVPTAFCVGSTLFLPSHSSLYSQLEPHFPPFTATSSATRLGLILGDGWSRQIPGNTHAEANALTNFRAKYAELLAGTESTESVLPDIHDVLRDLECYATMEPCSVRTSGGPSCALELVNSHVRAVYIGVEEPPDFVECQGVRILLDGGVEVIRVNGLEEECLEAARRGRD